MTNIFVGNLPYNVDESELRREFEQFGRVASVRIVTDPATNRSRGFGFVSMPSLDDADEAITGLSGRSLRGRRLTVNESQNDRPRDESHNSARAQALNFFAALGTE